MSKKHDFKGALDFCSEVMGVDHPHNKTIQYALRLADRLQSGDLQDVATEQHKLWEKYLGGCGDYYTNNGTAFLGCLNKAMTTQLMKEVENE
jgi:hypothetical protein